MRDGEFLEHMGDRAEGSLIWRTTNPFEVAMNRLTLNLKERE